MLARPSPTATLNGNASFSVLASVRYNLALLGHSQRYVPGVLTVFLCAVVMTVVSETWSVVEHHKGFSGSLGLSALASPASAGR